MKVEASTVAMRAAKSEITELHARRELYARMIPPCSARRAAFRRIDRGLLDAKYRLFDARAEAKWRK